MWHLAQETLASINICKGLTVRRRDIVFSKAKFPFLSPVDEVVETGSHGISAAYPFVPPLHFDWLKSEMFMGPCFTSVQLLSCGRLFTTPWVTARQASLSITNSQSSLRLTSIESVMSSSHLILCHPLLLLPPIFPSIRVFSNESTINMRWPKYW